MDTLSCVVIPRGGILGPVVTVSVSKNPGHDLAAVMHAHQPCSSGPVSLQSHQLSLSLALGLVLLFILAVLQAWGGISLCPSLMGLPFPADWRHTVHL